MKRLIIVPCVVIGMWLGGASSSSAAERGRTPHPPQQLDKTLGLPTSTKLNINRISSWYRANGEEERNPSTNNAGLTYPRGTSEVIYAAGLMWTGLHQDGRTPVLRTNGYSYNSGTKPGAILGIRTGVAEDPAAPDVRIFRIRRDYATADLRQDAAEINSIALASVTDAQVEAVRAQYAKDWMEWPYQKGAPFYDDGYVDANGDTVGANNGVLDRGEDANMNGILDAGEDANSNGVLDGETPGVADADQVIWYVANDLGVQQPWTNIETGMELQTTIWGYSRSDALGNVLFKRYRLIYKGILSTPGDARIDSMYMAQWSDPDVGDSGNDFAGCDTMLSLGFAYNGLATDPNFSDFSIAPPAGGYDFLQGPLVYTGNPNDTVAIWNLKRRGSGYINLPMTAFIYFAAGGTYSDPPFSSQGGIQWNQMLRGLPPTPQGPPDPPRLVNPVTGQPTTFWLSGDPVGRTGWLDGSIDQPGDRRIILASGPFTMALGDTQELVSAFVGGVGNSNIKSVAVMKFNDRSVQLAYDNLFNLPKPPVAPKVRAVTLDRQILLDWEFDSVAVSKTEDPVYTGGYGFEGYKIYQLPSAGAPLSEGELLTEFDIANGVTTIIQETFDEASGEILELPVQFGTDNGISRTLRIQRDELRSRPLVNGQHYYFALTAYNYTPQDQPIKTLESQPTVIDVVPETPKPGTRYPYAIGDSVNVVEVQGTNDAHVSAIIFNPTVQEGHSYTIRFDTTTSAHNYSWTLSDATSGKLYYSNITNFDGETPYRIKDNGFDVYVAAPPTGLRRIVDANGSNLYGASSSSPDFAILDTIGSLTSLDGGGGLVGRDFEIRFDGGSFALRKGFPFASSSAAIHVPFSVWDVGRGPSDSAKQVIAVVGWDRDTSMRNTWSIDTAIFVQGSESYRVFEPIYVTTFAYPSTNDSATVKAMQTSLYNASNSQTGANTALFNILIATFTGQPPPSGTVIKFVKYHEIHSGDTRSFNPLAPITGNVALARDDVTLVNAFPNPYYGINRAETNRVNRFITFNHLPTQATIRIFNLAGVLVRTLKKDDASTQYVNWDLQNENGLPVASGMYIAYVELKDSNGEDLGKKILKLAIIQEQQFLRNY